MSKLKVTFSAANNRFQYDGSADRIFVKGQKKKFGKLFLGDRDSGSMVQLKHRDTRFVVNCQIDMHGLSKEDSVKYLNIDPIDNNKSCLEAAYFFIDQALSSGENVLIFCQTGLGKSASILLYYLMKKEQLTFADAHRVLESQRPGATSESKTSGFRVDLVNLLLATEKDWKCMPHLKGKRENSIHLEGRTIVYTNELSSSELLSGRSKGFASSKTTTNGGNKQQPQSIIGPSIAFLIFASIVYCIFYKLTGGKL